MNQSSTLHLPYFLFTSVVGGVVLLFGKFLPQTIHGEIWGIFAFVGGLSYVMAVVTQWLYSKSPQNFIPLKFLGMLIRIFGAVGFICVYIVLGMENIILFIANFFLIFLFYLIFDIYTFLSNLRPISR